MKIHSIEEFKGGWFIGDFEPSLLSTKDFEVAVKRYHAGDVDKKHYHKVATEITVVVSGTVRMNGKIYDEGTVIVMEPGEATDFEALTDVRNVVIKVPSVKGDKYEEGGVPC